MLSDLLSTFTEMDALMRHHLEEEEIIGLPMVRKAFTAKEYMVAEKKIVADLKPSDMAWALRHMVRGGGPAASSGVLLGAVSTYGILDGRLTARTGAENTMLRCCRCLHQGTVRRTVSIPYACWCGCQASLHLQGSTAVLCKAGRADKVALAWPLAPPSAVAVGEQYRLFPP